MYISKLNQEVWQNAIKKVWQHSIKKYGKIQSRSMAKLNQEVWQN